MEVIISSMEDFQFLRILSFTPRAEFPREGYVLHMALFFCFSGFVVAWWRKYIAQSAFVLSFNFHATRAHQIQRSGVPSMVSHINSPTTSAPAEENESLSKGKKYVRFESLEELPAHDFSQNREAADSCKNYATSFSPSSDNQMLGARNHRNYEEESLESRKRDVLELLLSPKDTVKSFDVSQSRKVLAASTVDNINVNTVRVWDVPTSRCVNYLKPDKNSLVAGARFSSSPNLNLLCGIAISEQCKFSLYVWDTRNFPKPLSFSLGKKWGFDIVEFSDKKVYVCDDLSESVFDLRMAGAAVVEAYPWHHV